MRRSWRVATDCKSVALWLSRFESHRLHHIQRVFPRNRYIGCPQPKGVPDIEKDAHRFWLGLIMAIILDCLSGDRSSILLRVAKVWMYRQKFDVLWRLYTSLVLNPCRHPTAWAYSLMVKQPTHNRSSPGSIPGGPTNYSQYYLGVLYGVFHKMLFGTYEKGTAKVRNANILLAQLKGRAIG